MGKDFSKRSAVVFYYEYNEGLFLVTKYNVLHYDFE